MSTLQVDRIEPYQSASVTIVGLDVDTTALNNFTASQEALNGTFATTGSNSFVGNQTITGIITQLADGTAWTRLVQNPDYFSAYYGSVLNWSSTNLGGISTLILSEKTKAYTEINAWSGAYDNKIRINVDSNGVQFNDWDLPSYGESTWLSVQQSGIPTFQRGLEVQGKVGITEVLALGPQDPLPAGDIGNLALSGSSLYFYDGSWREVSLV